MSLESRQIKTQEAVIMKWHDCSLEEAYKKECILTWKSHAWLYECTRDWSAWDYWTMTADDFTPAEFASYTPESLTPPTLSRVLHALWFDYMRSNTWVWRLWDVDTKVCDRDLKSEDGGEAMLWDQDIKTQKTIWQLLGVEF